MSSLSAQIGSVDLKSVEEVRELFLSDYNTMPERFDSRDVDRILKDPIWLQRFLARKYGDVASAAIMLRESLIFRHAYGVPAMRDQDFPDEFYKIGGCFLYEPDRFGNHTLYIRVKLHRRVPEVMDLLRGFFIHQFDKMDMAANGRGMAIIYDLTGAGFANADLELALFLTNTLQNYCPAGISYIMIYEMPSFLAAIWRLVFSWIPGELKHLFKLTNKKSVRDFIAADSLPDFMGGSCARDYRSVPEGCINTKTLAEMRNISEKKLKALFDLYYALDEKVNKRLTG